MTGDRKKPGVAFWTTMVLSLPVLYVLSFGPMRMVGVHYEMPPPTAKIPGFGFSIEGPTEFDAVPSAWYKALYQPLIWACWQPWGTPLVQYKYLFPIREVRQQSATPIGQTSASRIDSR
jgi:hypothetical protein